MSEFTNIQWCDSTVNPVAGCSGCELAMGRPEDVCYARRLTEFFGAKGKKGWPREGFFVPELMPGRMAKAAKLHDLTGKSRLEKPWLDGSPRLIFVSDMGDALSETRALDENGNELPDGIPFGYLKSEVIDVVVSELGKRHQWLWLTKRPNRMAKFSNWILQEFGISWPPNLWAGTSVTTSATLSRIDDLSEVGTSNTIRFVSVEPLWEEVSLADCAPSLSWVILGGESKQKRRARRFELAWARRIRHECTERSLPLFVKQLGGSVTDAGRPQMLADAAHGGDWSEWPIDLRIRHMPHMQVLAWTRELVEVWAHNAKPHVRLGVLLLATHSTPLTTAEINQAVGASARGAIVGGLNKWASHRCLPHPICRSDRHKSALVFASPKLAGLFAMVLQQYGAARHCGTIETLEIEDANVV